MDAGREQVHCVGDHRGAARRREDGVLPARLLRMTSFPIVGIQLSASRRDIGALVVTDAVPAQLAAGTVCIVMCDRPTLVTACTLREEIAALSNRIGTLALIDDAGIAEREQALLAGFDDAVESYIHARELECRIAAVHRRVSRVPTRVRCGSVVVDLDQRIGWNDGRRFSLAPREAAVLNTLVAADEPLTYSQLYAAAWGELVSKQTATHQVHLVVGRIRAKLGDCAIKTIRGVGVRVHNC